MGFSYLILAMTIATAVAFPANYQNYLVMPHSKLSCSGCCLSWRVGVEANNVRNWTEIPEKCMAYIPSYMLGREYPQDCDLVCDEAYDYAKGLNLTGDGKDVWVFDIDETTLSNIPYFVAQHDWKINVTTFAEWMEEAAAPAIPAALNLYKKLIKLGFKIVFLTGAPEKARAARRKNLKKVGYTEWEKLLLRKNDDHRTALVYKSSKRKELEKEGYRIRGNSGDQWSDITGNSTGDRTFKMPNPVYYVP